MPTAHPPVDTEVARAAPAVQLCHTSRSFGGRAALRDVSLTIAPGERVALIGPSGSGKSTLLRLLAGLLTADRGSGPIHVLGKSLQRDGRLSAGVQSQRGRIGFVFQQFNLVGRLPVLTNVLIGRLARMPLWRSLPRAFTPAERRAAMQALARVGLADRAAQRASTLSGGQQQRVAIARAIHQEARVILADEPIASLDPESARVVMELLTELTRREGATLLISLHQVEIATRYCERVVALHDGQVRFDGSAGQLTPAILRSVYGGGWPELLEENQSLGTGWAPRAEASPRTIAASHHR